MDFFDSTTTIKERSELSIKKNISYPNRATEFCTPQINVDVMTNRKYMRLFFTHSYPQIIPFNSNEINKIKRPATEIYNLVNPKIMKLDPGESNHKMTTENEFEDAIFSEMGHNESYSDYKPTYLKLGSEHPFPIVESRSLATIKSPKIKYSLKMPKNLINKGLLSNVQLEAIIYACQRHEVYLKNSGRASFLVGDGAGVGKGRTVSGIILENYLMGKTKAIWLSVSNDLKEDAVRDLGDLGNEIGIKIQVKSLNKMSYKRINSYENDNFDDGVLFITYSSLISTCKKKGKDEFKSRLDQIVEWFGIDYDGVIIFDECHKAKEDKTKTGISVIKLQEILKHSRIVYSSATGASEPKHMAYMVRLGLWGPGTAFKNFTAYKNTLLGLGVGAMELIAMELKTKGMYLARQLHFKNVKFEIQIANVEGSIINGHKFEYVYNRCVELWETIYREFLDALRRNNNGHKNVVIQSQYWASHQRFFKYLCISAKIQECLKIVTNEIQQGKCVVIGLQSTGESRIMSELGENSGELSDFVSTAEGVVKNLVEHFYPSIANLKKINGNKSPKNDEKNFQPSMETGDENGPYNIDLVPICLSDDSSDCFIDDTKENIIFKKPLAEENNDLIMSDTDYYDEDSGKIAIKNNPSISFSTEDEKRIHALFQKIGDIKDILPVNALDEIIYELGGPDYVAEMTGRKGRVVNEDGSISYKSRKELGICTDQINLKEKDRFNNGEKLIAIISDAASIGISLHSDKRFANNRQRVHLTLELPWSADKAVQQFGRTHRSNQVIPPHYIFLISDLAGEKRFAATVAKRLESLGALTHGDRRCADTSDLSQFNLDNQFGFKAVGYLLSHIFKSSPTLVPYPSKYLSLFKNKIISFRIQAEKSLRSVGIDEKSKITVVKFLNRLLGIRLDMQNALFQYFADTVEYIATMAKLNNEFDHGIRDLGNGLDSLSLMRSTVYNVDKTNNDDMVTLNKVKITNKGVTYKFVLDRYVYDATENMFCASKNNPIRLLAFAEFQNNKYKIITPNFPEKAITRQQFQQKYDKIDFQDAQGIWEYIYRESENKCLHVIGEQNCESKNCTFGKRIKFMHILTGSVLFAMNQIRFAFPQVKLEIVRAKLDDGTKLVGALIPESELGKIMDVLSGNVIKKKKNTIKQREN